MNGNAELLDFIFQNAQMGRETLEHLLEHAQGERFIEQLKKQLEGYRRFCGAARSLLNEHGVDEKDIPGMQKMSAYLMINFKTMTDRSPSHIAEMLIIGSSRGVIDALRNLRKYDDADEGVQNLMRELMKMEENNIEALKEYL